MSVNFNFTEFGEIMMKLNIQDQRVNDIINDSESSASTYKHVVMGPQGTTAAVTRYLPSLTGPMK